MCILSSNLDEFFEIRISSLKEQQRQSPNLVGPDGMTPDQAFDNVQRAVHELVTRQYALLNDEICRPCRPRASPCTMPLNGTRSSRNGRTRSSSAT